MEIGSYAFISYSSKNQAAADALRRIFTEQGIANWMAPYDIPSGSKYAAELNKALKNCGCLVLLLSEASQASEHVDREVERALSYKKPIVPVQIEDVMLNDSFEYYIGACHIIAVPEIRADSAALRRVLDGVRSFVGAAPVAPPKPIPAPAYTQKPAPAEEALAKLKQASVGDYVTFGAYRQSGSSNGKEKIEWRVLDKKDGKILVISKYALDCQPYNKDREYVTWQTSSLRTWLNNDFLQAAFSPEERAMIPTVTVPADKNPSYSTNPGNATQDQVFLLSIPEAKRYFGSSAERQCKPTKYVRAQGAVANGNCWWLLRSPGHLQYTAAIVDDDGDIYVHGYNVNHSNYAVRPALWIDLNS